jgi:hypothetical protein
LVYGRYLKGHQCRTCGHQETLAAGTIMQATLPPDFCQAGVDTHYMVPGFLSDRPGQDRVSSLDLNRI